MHARMPSSRAVRIKPSPRNPQQDQSTLDEFVARQVDRSIKQVVLSVTTELGQVARRHLAAAGTGVSAGWAVWSYPVIAVPITIAAIVYWIIVSK